MSKPKFSIVCITKQGAKTLPKLFDSLKEFISRGGEIVVVSTGSTDNTIEVAKSAGAVVHEVGLAFVETIDSELARNINNRFIVGGEEPIVKEGAKLFNFAEARNYATSLATNDFIFTVDDDEFMHLDIDKINNLIDQGVEQFEYNFVFAFAPDQNGQINRYCRRIVEFTQSKAYDRRKISWKGVVHENLYTDVNVNRTYVGEDTIFLGHAQEQGKDHRGNYIVGLALDCYNNPQSDRNSHYLAREMMWLNRPKSALKEFERHIAMNRWPAERAQSMIYCGDIHGLLGDVEKQKECYLKAFDIDSNRREALLKLANVYLNNKNYQAAISYATATLQIPHNAYYANDMRDYRDHPHSIIYRAAGWLGNIGMAQHHLMECLRFEPFNERYIDDTKFYFPIECSKIQGWMSFPEQMFLYSLGGRGYKKIAECGAWKGRGTNAIAKGAKDSQIWCIDTWQGSSDVHDSTNWMAKQEDVYSQFLENTKQFTNITPVRKDSVSASKDFEDEFFDCIFIDMGHTYDDVMQDLIHWYPKLKKGGAMTGHDYMADTWQKVIEAVDDFFGCKPAEIHDTIWVHYKR